MQTFLTTDTLCNMNMTSDLEDEGRRGGERWMCYGNFGKVALGLCREAAESYATHARWENSVWDRLPSTLSASQLGGRLLKKGTV